MTRMEAKRLKEACEEVERFARLVGRDCEIVFMDRGVQVAPLEWSGCVTARDLYAALRQAERES